MDLEVIMMCEVSSSFVKIIPLWWRGCVQKREKLYMDDVRAYMGNLYIFHSICCKSKK